MNIIRTVILTAILSCLIGSFGCIADEQEGDAKFTADFQLENCSFESTGENAYFILRPGYQLVLEGEEDGEEIRVEITVLNETEDLLIPDIGQVEARVVEEREYEDEEIVEISRNFFAICSETSAVYYFGEDVDIYDDGEIESHEGTWRAGEDGAMPGLIMPGTFLLGSRYFQEQAPGVAMDLGENIEMGLSKATEAGTFDDCVKVEEMSSLDPDDISYKVYCPGVGLVMDDELELIAYGEVADAAV